MRGCDTPAGAYSQSAPSCRQLLDLHRTSRPLGSVVVQPSFVQLLDRQRISLVVAPSGGVAVQPEELRQRRCAVIVGQGLVVLAVQGAEVVLDEHVDQLRVVHLAGGLAQDRLAFVE